MVVRRGAGGKSHGDERGGLPKEQECWWGNHMILPPHNNGTYMKFTIENKSLV